MTIYKIDPFDISLKREITMAKPIWKDYFVNLGAFDSVIYRIKADGIDNAIYTGKAYKRPGETNISIRINEICADFLSNGLPNLSQAEFTLLAFPLTFHVQIFISTTPGEDPDWEDVESVSFINDWSYDYGYIPESMGMAFPISHNIDKRQWVVYTAYNASSIVATIKYGNGSTSEVIIPVEITADFNADFNNDFARSARSAGSGTAVFRLTDWEDAVSITIGNHTFNVVTECKEWALYYTNAYGGWDSLLIEGNAAETDNLERFTRMMEYDNNAIQNRGKVNFANEITKTYQFHTGWLNDEQSSRMHHLVNSTDVYLLNIPSGEMLPVNILDSACEYKTFKGNGNRLVNYDINVEVAQNRIRR